MCRVLLSGDTRRQEAPHGVAMAVRIVRQMGGPFQVARKLGAQVLVCWVCASGDCVSDASWLFCEAVWALPVDDELRWNCQNGFSRRKLDSACLNACGPFLPLLNIWKLLTAGSTITPICTSLWNYRCVFLGLVSCRMVAGVPAGHHRGQRMVWSHGKRRRGGSKFCSR